MRTILIVAGASGGHVFPALSLAQKIQAEESQAKVIFVTREGKIEKAILENSNIGLIVLDVDKITFSLSFVSSLSKLVRAFFRSYAILKKENPNLVIGFGGYISIPVILSAFFKRIPSMLHEQNVLMGKANKFLALFVNKVAFSFEKSLIIYKNSIIGKKMVLTGNPIREDYFAISKEQALKEFDFDQGRFTLAIIGGSQGSANVNRYFKGALSKLDSALLKPLQIIHICGKKYISEFEPFYSGLGIKFRLFDFFKDISLVYRAADLVISRAGATSIAELTSYRKESILIPYPHAGGHQIKNAEILKDLNLAYLVEDREGADLEIKDLIEKVMQNRRLSGNAQAGELDHRNAAQKLANEVLTLC